jgi:hypothetical protein
VCESAVGSIDDGAAARVEQIAVQSAHFNTGAIFSCLMQYLWLLAATATAAAGARVES